MMAPVAVRRAALFSLCLKVGPLARGDAAPLDRWLAEQGELDEDGSSGPSVHSIRERLATAELLDMSNSNPAPTPREAPSRLGGPAVPGATGCSKMGSARRIGRQPTLLAQRLLLSACLHAFSSMGMLLRFRCWPPLFLPATCPLRLDLPGALDLFMGVGGIASRVVKFGAPWALTWEIERSSDEDLNRPQVRKLIEALIKAGCFRSFGAAPVCASFSRAVHPPWRSSAFPLGLPHLSSTAFRLKRQRPSIVGWSHAAAVPGS